MFAFLRSPQESSTERALLDLVRLLRLPVTPKAVRNAVLMQPEHASLNAIRSVLQDWRVRSVAVRISVDQLPEADYPCLAYVHTEGGAFVVLDSINEQYVRLFSRRKGYWFVPIAEFAVTWSGILLLIDPQEDAGEDDYERKSGEHTSARLARLFLSLLLATAVLTGLWNRFAQGDGQLNLWLSYYALKLVGGALAIALCLQHLGQRFRILDKVCTAAKSLSCSSVLNSKGALVLSWLSAAELGAFYFVGTWLTMLLAPYWHLEDSWFALLAIGTLCALPYTFFSIYYQAVIVRRWCILCLLVQVVLWGEGGVIALAWHTGQLTLSTTDWLYAAPVLITPALVWFSLKPLVVTTKAYQQLKISQQKFLEHPLFFETLLGQSQSVIHPSPEQNILLSEEPSALTVTIILSPTCYPCKLTFQEALKLERKLMGEVTVAVRFSATTASDAVATAVAEHVIALRQAGLDGVAALAEWYAQDDPDLTIWKARFALPSIVEKHNATPLLLQHQKWCQQHQFNYSPIVFIGDRLLPPQFTPADIELYLKHRTAKEII